MGVRREKPGDGGHIGVSQSRGRAGLKPGEGMRRGLGGYEGREW